MRVKENSEVLTELQQECNRLKLSHSLAWKGQIRESLTPVIFMPSLTDSIRDSLLANVSCLIYTPSQEHFGIVPVEAMARGTPVIAINSGGPKETIIDGVTGYLCEPTPAAICEKLMILKTMDDSKLSQMRLQAMEHVRKNFTLEIFGNRLEALAFEMLA